MKATSSAAIYWDTSAIVSALFLDDGSEAAMRCARSSATHLISSLAWTETHAVMARIERERALATVLVEAGREALESGPWRRLKVEPNWKRIKQLARVWPLRGADLWHLATAIELQSEIPELAFFSFDSRLAAAASGEGLKSLT